MIDNCDCAWRQDLPNSVSRIRQWCALLQSTGWASKSPPPPPLPCSFPTRPCRARSDSTAQPRRSCAGKHRVRAPDAPANASCLRLQRPMPFGAPRAKRASAHLAPKTLIVRQCLALPGGELRAKHRFRARSSACFRRLRRRHDGPGGGLIAMPRSPSGTHVMALCDGSSLPTTPARPKPKRVRGAGGSSRSAPCPKVAWPLVGRRVEGCDSSGPVPARIDGLGGRSNGAAPAGRSAGACARHLLRPASRSCSS